MEWINVKHDLPKPFEVVWVYWRDREVLLGCKTDNIDYCDPDQSWYSFEDEKNRWANYWMRVSASSLDKPDPPRKSDGVD